VILLRLIEAMPPVTSGVVPILISRNHKFHSVL
jgi:hypothetical protein